MKRSRLALPDEHRTSRIPFVLLTLAAAIGALLVVLRQAGRGTKPTETEGRGMMHRAPTVADVGAQHAAPLQTPQAEPVQTPALPAQTPKPLRRPAAKPVRKPLTLLEFVRRSWPAAVAIAVLLAILAAMVNDSLARNAGHLIYNLDDPYIHMTMARQFSQHGLWSMTRFEAFTSSTSSPLWTLLLSLVYWIFGVSDAAPFVMNIICAVLLLITTHIIFDRFRGGGFYSLAVMIGLIFFIPLPNLIFTGMEHTLQILIDLLFIYNAVRLLCLNERETPRRVITDLSGRVLFLGLFVPMVRYEGVFIIAFVCALFLARGRWAYALMLGGLSALPVVFYGFFSVVNGSDWLPNSLMLKVIPQSFSTLDGIIIFLGLSKSMLSYYSYPPLMTLTVGIVILLFVGYARRKTLWEASNLMLLIVIPTFVLHMQFAGVGWFFRYEAYLIALGVMAIALSVRDFFPTHFEAWMQRHTVPRLAAMFALLFVLTLPMLYRVEEVMKKVVPATTNIYEQQYQMGTFLREFYEGQRVALNDIGATTYLADIRLLDLYGLGTYEVATAKLNSDFDVDFIYRIARESNTQIAIVYDSWYPDLPEQWARVGQWTIQNNISAASPTVSFYAVDPGAREALVNNLREFAPRLPATVHQSGVYMQGPA
ncbi:MAG: hypothetical protein H7175_15630 [Burkholderiales bacterium]|nr:hypothetical protein [Anaerolineae bacterium]